MPRPVNVLLLSAALRCTPIPARLITALSTSLTSCLAQRLRHGRPAMGAAVSGRLDASPTTAHNKKSARAILGALYDDKRFDDHKLEDGTVSSDTIRKLAGRPVLSRQAPTSTQLESAETYRLEARRIAQLEWQTKRTQAQESWTRSMIRKKPAGPGAIPDGKEAAVEEPAAPAKKKVVVVSNEPPPDVGPALCRAAMAGDLPSFEKLIGINPLSIGSPAGRPRCLTPLMWACSKGSLDIARYIIVDRRYGQVNELDNLGATALDHAAVLAGRQGHGSPAADIVEILLAHGAMSGEAMARAAAEAEERRRQAEIRQAAGEDLSAPSVSLAPGNPQSDVLTAYLDYPLPVGGGEKAPASLLRIIARPAAA